MVEQNCIIYVNEKNFLSFSPIQLIEQPEDKFLLSYTIKEKHLICGLVLGGQCLKGWDIRNIPFSAVEKYLFEFSNLHFVVPQHNFKQSDINYSYLLLKEDFEDYNLGFQEPYNIGVQQIYSYFGVPEELSDLSLNQTFPTDEDLVTIGFVFDVNSQIKVKYFDSSESDPVEKTLLNLGLNANYGNFEKQTFELPKLLFDEFNQLIARDAYFEFTDLRTNEVTVKTYDELFL